MEYSEDLNVFGEISPTACNTPEKLVDEKIQSELNIEAGDNEIETIHPERSDHSHNTKNYKIQEVVHIFKDLRTKNNSLVKTR